MAEILIVDKDEMSRTLLETILVRAGHQVASAPNSPGARQVLSTHRPALMIIDDSASGVELCQYIKSQAELSTIPVVLSASRLVSDGGRALRMESGADAIIVKPWRREDVEAVTRSLLR